MHNFRLEYETGLLKDLILMIDEKVAELIERSTKVDDRTPLDTLTAQNILLDLVSSLVKLT
ncbi:MAG: hypothetical protein QOJ64_3802 [Acidobacteriota bacterium]|jgi:hypothetical protein|nr:hypothetical protein [Acidobacteriota bacterium]